MERSTTVPVTAVSFQQPETELLLDTNNTIVVPTEMLAMAMGYDNVEELTTEELVNLTITRQGSDITELKVVNC